MATLAAEVYSSDTDQPGHPYFEPAKKIVVKGNADVISTSYLNSM